MRKNKKVTAPGTELAKVQNYAAIHAASFCFSCKVYHCERRAYVTLIVESYLMFHEILSSHLARAPRITHAELTPSSVAAPSRKANGKQHALACPSSFLLLLIAVCGEYLEFTYQLCVLDVCL